MVSKTISITEPVYKLLVSHKQPKESFSQLFQRTYTSTEQRRRKIEGAIGAWEAIPEELVEQMLTEIERGRHEIRTDRLL